MGATKIKEISTHKGVKQLNGLLKDGSKHVFLLIFMDGCGPCNETRPEWKKISTENKGENVVIADVNSAVLDKSQISHVGNVSAFPTIKSIKNGKGQDYNGLDRTHNSFEKWIQESTQKPSSSIRGGARKRKRKITKKGKRSRKRKTRKTRRK
jgi:thiol-disulfide isomerase/thioredoxin